MWILAILNCKPYVFLVFAIHNIKESWVVNLRIQKIGVGVSINLHSLVHMYMHMYMRPTSKYHKPLVGRDVMGRIHAGP